MPPRRSPTPLPPRRSPTPPLLTEPVGPAVGTPPARPTVGATSPTGPVVPSAVRPASGGVPQVAREAPADMRQKAAVSREARRTASEPTGDKTGPVSSRPSLMNHPHLAGKLLLEASTPAIREEIRKTDSRTLFKDGQTAMLRAVNVFSRAQTLVVSGERRLEQSRREAFEYRDRATKAEDALKLTQAGEAERLEIVRSQARAEATAAQQQMRKVLERALLAEGKLLAVEAGWAEAKVQLEAAKSELRSSEEKIEIAEEVARLADLKAAEAMEAVRAADKKSAESAGKAVEIYRNSQAFLEEMAGTAARAVEGYRSSPTFIEEVAEAGAGAYLQGFYCCRAKAIKVSGVEGLRDLEPEEGDIEDEGVDQGPTPDDDVAPPANPIPIDD